MVRALPESAWTLIEVRDGEKGPLQVGMMARRVQARDEHGRVGEEETLVVIRRQEESDKTVVDYYLSEAPIETPLAGVRPCGNGPSSRGGMLPARDKSEAGLADYEVRTYHGWYHHQTMSLMALWFLVEETGREKKGDACIDRSSSSLCDLLTVHAVCACHTMSRIGEHCERRLRRNQTARLYHWKQHNRLPPLNINTRRI